MKFLGVDELHEIEEYDCGEAEWSNCEDRENIDYDTDENRENIEDGELDEEGRYGDPVDDMVRELQHHSKSNNEIAMSCRLGTYSQHFED